MKFVKDFIVCSINSLSRFCCFCKKLSCLFKIKEAITEKVSPVKIIKIEIKIFLIAMFESIFWTNFPEISYSFGINLSLNESVNPKDVFSLLFIKDAPL